jgi:hypothetical protein
MRKGKEFAAKQLQNQVFGTDGASNWRRKIDLKRALRPEILLL